MDTTYNINFSATTWTGFEKKKKENSKSEMKQLENNCGKNQERTYTRKADRVMVKEYLLISCSDSDTRQEC